MKPKTILHIIDSFSRIGGAEKILVSTIESLNNYNNILVVVSGDSFNGKVKNLSKSFSLNFNSKWDFLKSLIVFKKIINQNNIYIVHSHLYHSMVFSRLIVPKKIPLISSYHSLLYDDSNSEQFSKKMLFIDKILLRPYHYSIFVSRTVKNTISAKVQSIHSLVLYNFINDIFFKIGYKKLRGNKPQKFVAVGNLRLQKNYMYLLRVFSELKGYNISLDIFGVGDQYEILENFIRENELINVTLKGLSNNIDKILEQYDVFLISSTHEGFGISLIEAMAVGIPCMASNIATFREVGKDGCLYFDLNDEKSLVKKIKLALEQKLDLNVLSNKAQSVARFYNKNNYMKKLNSIYTQIAD